MISITKPLIVSFISNLILSVLKMIFGVICSSQVLIADGVHSFSDLVTDIVAFIGTKFAFKKEDLEHPFGHGKLEYITSIFIACLILFLGYNLIINGITAKSTIPNPLIMIFVLITIIQKYFVARYLLMVGKQANNQILIASGRESYTDVISSIFALIIILLSQFSNKLPFLESIDKIGGIVIGIIIMINGFKLLIDNTKMIIGEVETNPEFLDLVRNEISILDLPIALKKFEVLKYGPYDQMFITLLLDDNVIIKDYYEYAMKIDKQIKEKHPRIKYVIINVEPKEGSNNARKTRGTNSRKKLKK